MKGLRSKITKLPKAVIVILGIAVVGLFLLALNLLSIPLTFFIPNKGYLLQCAGELVTALVGVGLLFLFGYGSVLKEKGRGFAYGFYVGAFFLVYCGYVWVAMLLNQFMGGSVEVDSVFNILIYTLTMFLVGFAEEIFLRGVVLHLFLDAFSKTRRGLVLAMVLSSAIFGLAHFSNLAVIGANPVSVLIQVIQAAVLGMLFAIIYMRSGNIWVPIIIHACVDFGSLMATGIFKAGNMVDGINQISYAGFIMLPVLLTPCFILLRKSRMKEMLERLGYKIPDSLLPKYPMPNQSQPMQVPYGQSPMQAPMSPMYGQAPGAQVPMQNQAPAEVPGAQIPMQNQAPAQPVMQDPNAGMFTSMEYTAAPQAPAYGQAPAGMPAYGQPAPTPVYGQPAPVAGYGQPMMRPMPTPGELEAGTINTTCIIMSVLGFMGSMMGMGIGFAITALCGSIVSSRLKPRNNTGALVIRILSIVEIVIAILMTIMLCYVYSNSSIDIDALMQSYGL